MAHIIFIPAFSPSFILSIFPAPRFWAVKLDIPLPMVVKLVITRLFSFIPPAYPAITPGPKLLIVLCIKMFPTDTKLCCSVEGMATDKKSFKRGKEKKGALLYPSTSLSLFATTTSANTHDIPWQMKVAQATPATPIFNPATK